MSTAFNVSVLFMIVGVMVALVNILAQVIKQVTWNKIPTNLLVLILSVALTLVAGVAYAEIMKVTIVWYMVVAAIIVGFLVAYAAMFGFDKLKEMLAQAGIKTDPDSKEFSDLDK